MSSGRRASSSCRHMRRTNSELCPRRSRSLRIGAALLQVAARVGEENPCTVLLGWRIYGALREWLWLKAEVEDPMGVPPGFMHHDHENAALTAGISWYIPLADLKLDELYVVYPGEKRYPLTGNVEVVPLAQMVNAK